MASTTNRATIAFLLLAGALAFIMPSSARAHCDTMDGPVIAAAKQALDTGNINFALVWVQLGDEALIRDEFDRAHAARRAGATNREGVERRFFETLVRIHRAGEGAPYTGIKPAGIPLDPAVRAADRSLETGSVDPVQELLTHAVQNRLKRNFQTTLTLRDYSPDDVAAGREYVKAYVTYTHFVEGVHRAAKGSQHQHEPLDEHGQGSGHGAGHAAALPSRNDQEGQAAQLHWVLVALLGSALVAESVIIFGKRPRTA